VSNSILPIIKKKSFKEILNIKLIDPACGSGTFLISSYEYILNYIEANEKRRLSYKERLSLFLNCIHGVDKDERAVDIAKLNISLKLAQKGEKLPHLSSNIICEDSLSFRNTDNILTEFGDWSLRFPNVFSKNNGFDIVIGNPPYLSAKDLTNGTNADSIRREFGDLDDLYSLFIRLSDLLLNSTGTLGFIVPNTFFTLSIHKKIRDLFEKSYSLNVLDLDPNVFKDAYVFNAIIIATKVKHKKDGISIGYANQSNLQNAKFKFLKYLDINKIPNSPIFFPLDFFESHDKKILNKLNVNFDKYREFILNSKTFQKNKDTLKEEITRSTSTEMQVLPLGIVSEGAQGLVTGNNSRYIGILPATQDDQIKIEQKFINQLVELKAIKEPIDYKNIEDLYEIAEKFKVKRKKPTLFGKKFLYRIVYHKNIRDFKTLTDSEKENGIDDASEKYWVLYSKGNENGSVWSVQSEQYIDWRTSKVKELKEGVVTNSRYQGTEFYFKPGFGWVDYFSSKIKGFFVDETVYSKNVVKFHSDLIDDRYLLALINSTLIAYIIKKYITNTRTLQINDGKLIPVIIPEKNHYQKIIHYVDNILNLKKEEETTSDHNKLQSIRKKINSIEEIIDKEIFSIYGYEDLTIQKEISNFILKNIEADILEIEDEIDENSE
jgi:hypothetical protein